jgi:hypothetical protein
VQRTGRWDGGKAHSRVIILLLTSCLNLRRQIQKGFINYMESVITLDPKIEELLQWESDKDMIAWLDNL